MLRSSVMTIVALAMSVAAVSVATACPFCSAVSQTFGEEIASTDAVVLARIVKLPAPATNAAAEVPKSTFEINEVIKGDALLVGKKQIETIFFGEARQGDQFLIMGVDPPKLNWSTPLKVSERAANYIRQIMELPKEGRDRLAFFQDYLEDKDELLARDAYDEFARAPFEVVQALKKDMDHDQLVDWIKDPNIPASRRRLYLVMLSVCGSEADLPMLESMLKSEDRKARSGLDAMISCYLTLKGAEGMTLVEDLFLKNKDAEYADTYSAIMAIRFHGDEAKLIERERLLEGLRYMLDRPQLADLVIPDLARWEDWSQVDRLVELYKNADAKSSWVRVPVVNYMRACPLPEAKKYMQILEKIDPKAVKRANAFFPFGGGTTAPASDDKTSASEAEKPALDSGADTKSSSAMPPLKPSGQLASANTMPRSLDRLATEFEAAPNRWTTLCVVWLAAAVVMLFQWRILRGAG